uniref:Uncharacterized protein n=1 Tax=Rhizophagus irregularis (strain DAOM 181602 / DAOM 197198 / MUCL 43194) TaxID=747089 RepID=U9SY35_RHIID
MVSTLHPYIPNLKKAHLKPKAKNTSDKKKSGKAGKARNGQWISWTFWNDSGELFGFSETVLADFLDFLERF